jgi:hypothetical protein
VQIFKPQARRENREMSTAEGGACCELMAGSRRRWMVFVSEKLDSRRVVFVSEKLDSRRVVFVSEKLDSRYLSEEEKGACRWNTAVGRQTLTGGVSIYISLSSFFPPAECNYNFIIYIVQTNGRPGREGGKKAPPAHTLL